MLPRLLAIAFIFGCTCVGWMILGSTIFSRTYQQDGNLRKSVESLWGVPQVQDAPEAQHVVEGERDETVQDGAKLTVRKVKTRDAYVFTPASSRIGVGLHLEHRQKGLLWFSTYAVNFDGTYRFTNTTDQRHRVSYTLKLPSATAVYDDLLFTVDGQAQPVTINGDLASVTMNLAPGATSTVRMTYRTQGLDRWSYRFGHGVGQVRDFALRMTTNFRAIDFPDDGISPSTRRETPDGWQLEWRYRNLLAGKQIALAMPEKLQPGPLAGRISYFAPVSLLFFFFLLFIISVLRGIALHPMHYFFLACSFFAFHLLLAYLVDHISIHAAFAVCSAVSIFLVVSYLRLVVGPGFAFREAALSQFVYLVLFSYAFFFEGFTALSVTIGAIVTLFLVMQLTARVRWEQVFRGSLAVPSLPVE